MDENVLEIESLGLVKELQGLLANALSSLAGKETEFVSSYVSWGAAHVNKLAGGYVLLREQSMIHASKTMIRPIIEAAFFIAAAVQKPGFLFQKAYSEFLEEKKLIPAQDHTEHDRLQKEFDAFEQQLIAKNPNCPVKREKVNVSQTAEALGLTSLYQYYRIYCQFTHGALRAATGGLDSATDRGDNLVVAWILHIVLDQAKACTPVSLPDLTSYWIRLETIGEKIRKAGEMT